MAHPLPHQLSQTLSQQWPCRETQIRQLAALLDVSITTKLHGNGCYLIAFWTAPNTLPIDHSPLRYKRNMQINTCLRSPRLPSSATRYYSMR